MKWYKSKILKKLFLETTDWNVAWKKEQDDVYKLVENPDGYWLADSLIFSCDLGEFLFVEAFDKKKNIGKLAVLKYDGEQFVDFKIIMEKKYHLSYPYVFEYKGQYYMIPETSGNNCIELYVSEKFPYTWKKITEIITGNFVDTTVVIENDESFHLYSYNMDNNTILDANLDMSNYNLINIKYIKDENDCFRAGGNVFIYDNYLVRPLQDNKYFYGQRLNVVKCNNNEKVFEIDPINIKTDKVGNYKRLHTYSKSGGFEAIDLSNFRFNLFKFYKKIKRR